MLTNRPVYPLNNAQMRHRLREQARSHRPRIPVSQMQPISSKPHNFVAVSLLTKRPEYPLKNVQMRHRLREHARSHRPRIPVSQMQPISSKPHNFVGVSLLTKRPEYPLNNVQMRYRHCKPVRPGKLGARASAFAQSSRNLYSMAFSNTMHLFGALRWFHFLSLRECNDDQGASGEHDPAT